MYFNILPVGALRLHGVDYGCHSTVKNKSSSGKMNLMSFCRKFIVDNGNVFQNPARWGIKAPWRRLGVPFNCEKKFQCGTMKFMPNCRNWLADVRNVLHFCHRWGFQALGRCLGGRNYIFFKFMAWRIEFSLNVVYFILSITRKFQYGYFGI